MMQSLKDQESVQDKNRKAQARFRERQKVKQAESDRRMRALEATVQRLQLERDALEMKSVVLERCLTSTVDAVQPAPPQPAVPGNVVASAMAGQQAMEWPEFSEWWTAQVHALAPLLPDARADPLGPIGQQVHQICRNGLIKASWSIMNSPDVRNKAYTTCLTPDADPPVPPPDKTLWRFLVESMELTDKQRQDCRDLRSNFLEQQAEILAKRATLSDTISIQGSTPDCDDNSKMAAKHSGMLGAVEELQESLKAEQLLMSKLAYDLYEGVIDHIQVANAIVGLWPWIPDKLAILQAVVDLDDDDD